MNTAKTALPPLTFLYRPGPEYTVQGSSVSRLVTSVQFDTSVPFDTLVLSVGYHTDTNGWLLSEVQLLQQGEWSRWVKLAFYSKNFSHSFDAQETDALALHVDELQAKVPAQAYRFRLTLHGDMEVSYVAVCVTPAQKTALPLTQAALLPARERSVSVHPISQMTLPVAEQERKRLCSPTSLTMALQTLQVPAGPVQVARAVYDGRANIFGNWTLNTAYASTQGFFACVTRFVSLAQLADFVNKDSLVCATISYKKGELSGAAVEETPGHLVLICGWQDGRVQVADPAAQNAEEVVRFYDAKEFARAWLINKRGAAYLVRKK